MSAPSCSFREGHGGIWSASYYRPDTTTRELDDSDYDSASTPSYSSYIRRANPLIPRRISLALSPGARQRVRYVSTKGSQLLLLFQLVTKRHSHGSALKIAVSCRCHVKRSLNGDALAVDPLICSFHRFTYLLDHVELILALRLGACSTEKMLPLHDKSNKSPFPKVRFCRKLTLNMDQKMGAALRGPQVFRPPYNVSTLEIWK
jgi:hypothetical protein